MFSFTKVTKDYLWWPRRQTLPVFLIEWDDTLSDAKNITAIYHLLCVFVC